MQGCVDPARLDSSRKCDTHATTTAVFFFLCRCFSFLSTTGGSLQQRRKLWRKCVPTCGTSTPTSRPRCVCVCVCVCVCFVHLSKPDPDPRVPTRSLPPCPSKFVVYMWPDVHLAVTDTQQAFDCICRSHCQGLCPSLGLCVCMHIPCLCCRTFHRTPSRATQHIHFVTPFCRLGRSSLSDAWWRRSSTMQQSLTASCSWGEC